MKIFAVIVTHNRLNLLQEAIAALRSQTQKLEKIVVVDNDSDDGTSDWLLLQVDLRIIHQQNSGGAGGFYTGIEYCRKEDCDYIWLMDDDTICQYDTLHSLVQKLDILGRKKVGFINSKSVWKDGTPHLMNLVDIQPFFKHDIPYNLYDQHQLLLTRSCSFVSVLINRNATIEIGLPYKEFFIWGDDQEYTSRLTAAGYLGFYCQDSLVIHKTPQNYHVNIYTDTAANSWKYKYGIRNNLFLIRRDKGIFYYIVYMLLKLVYNEIQIIRKRKDNKILFSMVLLKASFKSMFFYPKIVR